MSTDDLRTRAGEEAEKAYPYIGDFQAKRVQAFYEGFLAHAAQQPSREQIARALADAPDSTGTEAEDWLEEADAILALLNGAESNE